MCRESAVLPRCLSFCHPPPKFCITKYHFSSFIYTLTSLLSLLMGHFNFHISPYIPHHPPHLWVPFHLGLCQGCPTHFYFTPSHYSSSSPPFFFFLLILILKDLFGLLHFGNQTSYKTYKRMLLEVINNLELPRNQPH